MHLVFYILAVGWILTLCSAIWISICSGWCTYTSGMIKEDLGGHITKHHQTVHKDQ
jgi:hypothetical protein